MDLGLIKNNQVFCLPINIQPGESLKFYIKVGVLADPKAMGSFLKNTPKLDNLTSREIQYYMAIDSIDIFGNSIDVAFFEKDLFTFRLSSNKKQRIYALKLETGRKTDLICKLRWYSEFVIE